MAAFPKRRSSLPVLAALLLPALHIVAADYYVDFDGGLDTNAGTSPASTFKHCPGDSNATDKAAAVKFAPDDKIIFKGGVSYRGTVKVSASGAKDKPIILDGNTDGKFGTGPALIEGADPLRGWKKCASIDEAMGNPNWANLWYTDQVPADADATSINPCQGDRFMYLAEGPVPTPDLFWWDNLKTAKKITSLPVTDAANTTLVDADFFTQKDPHAWDGAFLSIRAGANHFYVSPVTGYEPDAHRISAKSINAKFYSVASSNGMFVMLNTMSLLTQPRQFVLSTAPNGKKRLFCWPEKPETLEQDACLGMRAQGIVISGSFLTVRGFILQHFAAQKDSQAVALEGLEKSSDLVIRDNEIRWMRTPLADRGAALRVSHSQNVTVADNKIHDNLKTIGLIIYFCEHTLVDSNVLRRNGDTAADFYGCKDAQVLGNKVTESYASHANGLTFYVNCNQIVVNGNFCACLRPLTFEAITNIQVLGNVFDAMHGGNPISIWSNPQPSSNVLIENNTLVNSNSAPGASSAGIYNDTPCTNLVICNNIIDGLGGSGFSTNPFVLQNNLFLRPGPALEGKSLGDGGILETDPAKVFVNFEAGDYHLKKGSPALGAGKASVPRIGMDGSPQPSNKTSNIGAY